MDRPMQAIDRCLSELAELCNPQPVPYFLGCGPILGLLPPDLRAQLVQGAININNLTLRGEAIAELAAGTGELSQEDCSSLFHAAVDIFHGNGNGSPFERIYGTAVVLAGLLEGPNFLEQERREEIINFATALVEMGANRFNNASIDGLGKAIRFLPDHVRGSLVGRVINADDGEERSLSLANLGFAVSTVPDLDVFGHAIVAALHLEELEELEDVECRAAAIGGLAAAMVSMEPMLRQNFVIVALNFFDEPLSSEIACKLGAAAEFLSDNERNTLVNLATVPSANPFHGPTALAEHQSCLSTRVSGLAAGMAFLTVPQRQALVQTALGFSDIEAKAEAIGAMGQGLQHLHAAQRNELVDAALTFGDNNDIPNLTAITSLGAGARHLDKTQRNRLIDAVISIIETDPDAVRETAIAKLSALSAIAASVSTEI